MTNPLELVKAHPILTVGGVVIAIIIFVTLSSGGSQTVSDGSGGVDTSLVGAGVQLQQAQIAASAQRDSAMYAYQAQSEQTAAGLEAARIAATYQSHADDLAASVASQQINAYQQVTTQSNTLSSQLEQAKVNADVKKNSDTLAVLTTQIQANQAISTASINAQLKAQLDANQPHGLFSAIFG